MVTKSVALKFICRMKNAPKNSSIKKLPNKELTKLGNRIRELRIKKGYIKNTCRQASYTVDLRQMIAITGATERNKTIPKINFSFKNKIGFETKDLITLATPENQNIENRTGVVINIQTGR